MMAEWYKNAIMLQIGCLFAESQAQHCLFNGSNAVCIALAKAAFGAAADPDEEVSLHLRPAVDNQPEHEGGCKIGITSLTAPASVLGSSHVAAL